jgi:hypothetical protein
MPATLEVGKARIVAADHGEIHAFAPAAVIYDLDQSIELIRQVVGVYHPTCCSGLNVVLKLTLDDAINP